MITKTVFPWRYMQGYKMLDRLSSEMALFGKRGLCILTPSAHKALSEKLQTQSDAIQLDMDCSTGRVANPKLSASAQEEGSAAQNLFLQSAAERPSILVRLAGALFGIGRNGVRLALMQVISGMPTAGLSPI